MQDFERVYGGPAIHCGAGRNVTEHWKGRHAGGVRGRLPCALTLFVLALGLPGTALPLPAQVAVASPGAGPPPQHAKPQADLPPLVLQAQRFLAGRGLISEATASGITGRRSRLRPRQVHPGVRAMAQGQVQQAATAPTWTPLGPTAVLTPSFGLVTGRVSALAPDPSDPTGNTLYLGTTGGGVWKSQNAEASAASVTFAPLTDDVQALYGATDASISIGALTVQPGGTGVILAGTGDPNDLLDSYYGAGILRSSDGGNSWSLIANTVDQETSANAKNFSFVGEGFAGFAWSTTQPQLVVAAVSQAFEGLLVDADQPNQSYEGLYYSADAGASWHLAAITDGSGQDVQGSPSDPFIYPDGNAATSVVWNPVRQLFMAAVRYHGYYQSTDGVTWTRMAFQPGAGLTTAACPANTGGYTGLITCPIFRGTLAVNPETGDTFAWTVDANDQDQGLWQDQCALTSGVCANAGVTFAKQWSTAKLETSTNQGGATIENGAYTLALAAVPAGLGLGQDTLLMAGATDLWKCSLAMGCVWRNTTNTATCMGAQVAPFQHALAWNAADPEEIFIGNDSGLWRSIDAIDETGQVCAATDASHFENLNGSLGSLAEVVSLPQLGNTPYALMAGLGVNGTAGVKGSTGPSTDWPQILGGEGGPVAIDPHNNANWFVNGQDGVGIYVCSQAAECTPGAFGLTPVVTNADVGNDGAKMRTPAPFMVDPADSAQLLIGTCRVWRGPADGSGWAASNAVSPVLDTDATSVSCNGDALIRSMAALPLGNGTQETVYVGMYGTLNGGAILGGHVLSATIGTQANAQSSTTPVWTDLTLNPVTNDSNAMNKYGLDISSIYVDPHDLSGQTVYVTVAGMPGLSGAPQLLYRSTDGGAHWANVANNLTPAPANSVVVDPQTASTVYVATDAGVYFTTAIATCTQPNSNCWSVFGSGLPGAPVVQLSTSPGQAADQVLAAGTYGRGIWVTPLWSAEVGLTTAAASPNALSFVSQAVGSASSGQTVTLTNTGSVALIPTAITASGDFSETDNCLNATVPVGGSCSIQVVFAPTGTGSRTGQVVILGNIDGQVTVNLSGTGTPAGTMTLNPATVAFGQVELGATSGPLPISAQNSGATAITISSVTVTSPFVLASNSCGTGLLAAQSACQVQIEFAPTQEGGVAGTVTFTDSAGTQTAQLNGMGASPPTDSLPATSMTFPATVIGQLSPLQGVLFSNIGDLPLTSISVAATTGFQTYNDCGTQLPGHASCTISVQFAPLQPGAQTGTLTVSDALRVQTVALSGTGVAPATLTVSPTSLSFAALNPGQSSAAQTITITNGNSFAVSSLTFSAAPPFSETQSNCPASLAAGATCTASVIFQPSAYGTFTGSVIVSSPSVQAPATVELSGTALDFAVAITGQSSQTVSSGQTASFSMTVTPTWISSTDFSPGGTFTLQCNTPPTGGACTLTPPNNLTVSAGSSGTLGVQVSTGTFVVSRPSGTSPWGALPLACGLLILPLALWRRRNALAMVALLALLAGGVSSCTSSGGNITGLTGPEKTSSSTPAGTYSVPVTVSLGNVTHSATVMVTVD